MMILRNFASYTFVTPTLWKVYGTLTYPVFVTEHEHKGNSDTSHDQGYAKSQERVPKIEMCSNNFWIGSLGNVFQSRVLGNEGLRVTHTHNTFPMSDPPYLGNKSVALLV